MSEQTANWPPAVEIGRLVEGARVKRADLKGTILLADIGLLLSASFRYLATVISLERGIPAGQKRSYLPLFQS